MSQKISDGRRAAYYGGGALSVLGFLIFLSNMLYMGEFDGSAASFMWRPVLGMLLVMGGGVIRNIGARGIAGSGVVLNPEQARDELSPYSRMAGGMIRDALDADSEDQQQVEEVIKIKCRNCSRLNDEDARFCQGCGAPA